MKTSYTFSCITLSISILCVACSTPSQLLEKGESERAFKLAQKKIKSGKDLNTNLFVLTKSTDHIIQNELQYNAHLTDSPSTKDWVKAQNNYFKTLKDIAAANELVDGQLQNKYDQLCNQKIELDFKIVDHFYQNGEALLATHYDQLSKHHAREAYFEFQECISFGGDRFFQNLDDKKQECIYEGRIFFVSHNFRPSTGLFFRPLPAEADFEPDCVISASFGPISYVEHAHSSSTSYSKEIKVGTSSHQDTSGQIIYTPIYETVTAKVTTTKVTGTVSSSTYIYAENITGYCFKSDQSFRNSLSDSYKEISISGDKRALDSAINECSGPPAFFRSKLERGLNSDIDSDLSGW